MTPLDFKLKRLLLAAAIASPLWVSAAPQTYVLDTFHSYPHFSLNHLGMTTITGRFDKMTGKVTLDTAAKKGSIEVKIATASISTGDNKRENGARSRDDHLKSADFFNVAEFPEMTYKSTALHFSGETLTSVDGNLTLLGITKPVKLAVTHFKCGPHPFNKKAMCGAEASTTIKRTDFGMKFGVPAVGDDVKVWFSLEAYPE